MYKIGNTITAMILFATYCTAANTVASHAAMQWW
jgi:hypothetical protein